MSYSITEEDSMETRTNVSKKEIVETLRDLTASVKALRHKTVGGVLPECNREVPTEYVDWVEESIKEAEMVLQQFPEKP